MKSIPLQRWGRPIQYTFDRQKPFYSLVINYLSQLHSFKELAARGAGKQFFDELEERRKEEGWEETPLHEWLDQLQPEDGLDIAAKLIHAPPHDYVRPLGLVSFGAGDPVHVDSEFIAAELFAHVKHHAFSLLRAAGSLLIVGYEISKHVSDRSPIWEFFRHCRNAAAHNGRIHFRQKDRDGDYAPERPAEWRGLRLGPESHDKWLFAHPDQSGLLGPGDPIVLLWDIEQEYGDALTGGG